MMLRIGAFSRRGRVSVKALRHYEAIGLPRGLRRPSQRRGSLRPGLCRRLGSRRRPAIRARKRSDARALL